MLIQPALHMPFYRPGPTTPQEPQNLLRVTNKGCLPCQAAQGLGNLKGLGAIEWSDPKYAAWGLVSMASSGLSAYHGYKRTRSVAWSVVWGLAGAIFPIITPAIGVAQGFGKPKSRRRHFRRYG